jgi:isopentenyldiphosphate isomerase
VEKKEPTGESHQGLGTKVLLRLIGLMSVTGMLAAQTKEWLGAAAGSQSELVPVFEAVTRRVIERKTRAAVHRDGDWHQGSQALILRTTGKGEVQVLLQGRSEQVDISKGRYDQSLATQLLVKDDGDLERALKRGLQEELGLREGDVKIVQVGENGWLTAIKQYAEDPALLNREFRSLFLVQVDVTTTVRAMSPKVATVEWVDWEALTQRIQAEPTTFTKTARAHLLDPTAGSAVEQAIDDFLHGRPQKPLPFRSLGYYGDEADQYDVFVRIAQDGTLVIGVYDYATRTYQEDDHQLRQGLLVDKAQTLLAVMPSAAPSAAPAVGARLPDGQGSASGGSSPVGKLTIPSSIEVRAMLKSIPVKEIVLSAQFSVLTNDELAIVIRVPRSKKETAAIFRQWGYTKLPEKVFERWVNRVHRGKQEGTRILKKRLQHSRAIWGVRELSNVDRSQSAILTQRA